MPAQHSSQASLSARILLIPLHIPTQSRAVQYTKLTTCQAANARASSQLRKARASLPAWLST